MSVPPRPGSEVPPAYESDFRDDAAPRVPKPLPDRDRSWKTAAAVVVALVVIAVVLVVLL